MVAGTYQFVKNINGEGLLTAIGREVTPQTLAGIDNPNAQLVVEINGDDYVFLNTLGDAYRRETKFTLGKPFEEGDDKKSTTVVTKTGNKFIFTTSGTTFERYYEFSGSGVELVFNAGKPNEARRVYKKI